MTKTEEIKKMTFKRFFFAPSWSVFDVTLWITFAFRNEIVGKQWGHIVGFILVFYLMFVADFLREWGDN